MIDFDKLFENYLRDFLLKNKGKFSEEQLSEKLEDLYQTFATKKFDELDGKTPETYYKGKDLIGILQEKTRLNIKVDDYLLEELKSVDEDKLIALLDKNSNPKLLVAVINTLSNLSVTKCQNILVDLLFADVDSIVKDEICNFYENNDCDYNLIINRAVKCDDVCAEVCEILSYTTIDKRVTNILMGEFEKHLDKIPEYANYFARYNDFSTIDKLIEYANKVNDYIDYKELCIAIESIGGVPPIRDFCKDKNYKKIKDGEEKDEHKHCC